MATAADKKQWDSFHAALAKADAATEEFERGLRAKYGMNFQTSWLSSGQKTKLQQLRDRADRVADKVVQLLVRVSPRGDAWLSGVPSWWITRELTWEDAVRPRNEPLSVVPPDAWGSSAGRRAIDRVGEARAMRESPTRFAKGDRVALRYRGVEYEGVVDRQKKDGTVTVEIEVEDERMLIDGSPENFTRLTTEERPMGRRVMSRRQPSLPGFPDIPEELDIQIPNMPMWEQIGGDMNPGSYGAILARSDGNALELLEIQPVREHVGDGEAADVGFPFWSKEGYYDLSDLNPSGKEVKSALQAIGMDTHALEDDYTPTQRALVIAEALFSYGAGSEEGTAGWSKDVVPDKVKWMTGKIAGPEYLADEDDEFIRDVLLSDLDIDYEKYGPDEKEPESGLKVEVRGAGTVEITEWTDIQAANGEEQPEGEEVVRQSADVELEELLAGKHRGRGGITLIELAEMDDDERERAIVDAASEYIGHYGGTEEFVSNVGD